MNTSDYNILSTILTATALGGGTSLLINTLSELKDLKRKQELEKKITRRVTGVTANVTPKDLKELLLNDVDNEVKTASEKDKYGDAYTTMANVLGGILALGASYYGANKLYNYIKKQSLKDEQADIMKDYYDQLFLLKNLQDSNIVRGRTNKYGSIGTMIGGLGGLLLLGGLASTIMTRQILKDKYPLLNTENAYEEALKIVPQPTVEYADDRKRREDMQLEKEEVLRSILEENAEDADSALKLASTVTDLLKDEVNENIIKLAYHSETTNMDNLGIQGVVHNVANGKGKLLKQASSLEELFDISDSQEDTVKLASDPLKLELSFGAIAKDPVLKEAVVPAAAIQVLHAFPLQNKMASLIEPAMDDAFAKSDMSIICTINNVLSRAHNFAPFRKQAAEQLRKDGKLDKKIFDFPFDNGLTTHIHVCDFLGL